MTPGRIIPPTTKGHLHYGPIPNLDGVIEAINVEREDEEFNDLQSKISALGTGMELSPTMETGLETQRYHYHSSIRNQEAEPYEIMLLSHGVLCSRSASGRVFYRIAKHIEGCLN